MTTKRLLKLSTILAAVLLLTSSIVFASHLSNDNELLQNNRDVMDDTNLQDRFVDNFNRLSVLNGEDLVLNPVHVTPYDLKTTSVFDRKFQVTRTLGSTSILRDRADMRAIDLNRREIASSDVFSLRTRDIPEQVIERSLLSSDVTRSAIIREFDLITIYDPGQRQNVYVSDVSTTSLVELLNNAVSRRMTFSGPEAERVMFWLEENGLAFPEENQRLGLTATGSNSLRRTTLEDGQAGPTSRTNTGVRTTSTRSSTGASGGVY